MKAVVSFISFSIFIYTGDGTFELASVVMVLMFLILRNLLTHSLIISLRSGLLL